MVRGENPRRVICFPLKHAGAASGLFRARTYREMRVDMERGLLRIRMAAPHKASFGHISGPAAPGPLWVPLATHDNRGYRRAKI